MKQTLLEEVLSALCKYIEKATGVLPERNSFRLSRAGMLSLSTFVRQDAVSAAEAVRADLAECMLWDIILIEEVWEKNGWLIFRLSPVFFERLCEKASSLGRRPGTDYVSLRMQMLMRKPQAPCPDNARIHAALLKSLFADDKNRFTNEDDRAILTMTHGETGMNRVVLENACGTVAQALLMLHAPHTNVIAE